MEKSALKQFLFQYCTEFVNKRIENARLASESAQESANMEEKSSAGDKYETGRAMAQLEKEKALQQLDEANKLKLILQKINPGLNQENASPGNLVLTDSAHFFIAISVGKIEVESQTFFVVAPDTPIGKAIIGLHRGDSFLFNNRTHTIREIL
jgi:hypothetical protein